MSKPHPHHFLHKRHLASVTDAEEFILVSIFEEDAQKCFKTIELSTVEEIFKLILKYKSTLKVVFFDVSTLQSDEYESNYELLKAVKAFLGRHSIPCHFSSFQFFMNFNVLVAADIIPYGSDNIMVVNVGLHNLTVSINRYSINGYKEIMTKVIKDQRLQNNVNELCEIMGRYFIRKIILFTTNPNSSLLQKYANLIKACKEHDMDKKLIVIDSEQLKKAQTSGDTIIEMATWFFDRSHTRFYVVPHISKTIEVACGIGNFQKTVISVKHGHRTPIERIVFVSKMGQQCLMLKNNAGDKEILERYKLDEKCHRFKITLEIESECYPELKIEPVILHEIQNLPKKLNATVKSKIPVIGFFQHFSVICAHDNGSYKFLDSWNGLYGNELLINFDHFKPKYGMDSIKAEKTKMCSVVYDLIKIMTMSPDDISVNDDWKFKITKTEENLVLIEFFTIGGNRMTATPATLMSMLLQEHMRHITAEMGNEKPKEIGFCFFDEMTKLEKERVKKGLEESCKLMEIECRFIELSNDFVFLKLAFFFLVLLFCFILWYF